MPVAAPPAAPEHARQGLRDSHGRVIRDLRLSVTDRCNFRCTYCMEPDDRFLPRQQLLGLNDYLHIIDAAIGLGVTKLRITGGEPTLYPDLDAFIEAAGRRPLDDIAMTTNGWALDPRRVAAWKAAGLHRLTFSLDTLRDDRMAAITRSRTSVATVLESIDVARDAGFARPKINVVLQTSVNDDEAVHFAALARTRDLDVRFIEFMPLDSGRHWDRSTVVTAAQTKAAIHAVFALEPETAAHAAETSTNFRFADGAPGRVGFIAPVSNPFCGACNRLRITAEGMVRPCLFSTDEWDVRPSLATGRVEDVQALLQDATWTKQKGHGIGSKEFSQPARGMRAIGG
ncbi:MAG: GTP 3',8-cyclase MoaA [Phycisphaerales bacterium]|nr:GTP 3',8-cyclase MoaA [Phycisphaerales bacterium]